MSQSISDFYLNRIKQVTKKTSTNVYSLINISRYEENVIKKGKIIHKKNEIKKKEKIIKENSAVYKYLLHIDLRKIESKEFKINKKDEKKKELYKKIENYLEKLYKNGKLMEKFLHVMKYKKINMFNKINVIEFISGSYQKMSISATHKGAEPTRHSYIEKDETNGKYKYFYKFKTGRKEILENGKKVDEIIRIPVNYNKKFHGEDLSKLNLDKPMYVKRRENGKIMFGALTKQDREFVYKKGDIYAGIDLNLRDNFMCITVKEKGIEGKLHKVIKNEEEFDDKLILKYKEIRNYQEVNPEKYKKDLGKLCRIKEYQIKNIISETIKWLREKNVTNIVMEDLGFKNNKSRRKNNVDGKVL